MTLQAYLPGIEAPPKPVVDLVPTFETTSRVHLVEAYGVQIAMPAARTGEWTRITPTYGRAGWLQFACESRRKPMSFGHPRWSRRYDHLLHTGYQLRPRFDITCRLCIRLFMQPAKGILDKYDLKGDPLAYIPCSDEIEESGYPDIAVWLRKQNE